MGKHTAGNPASRAEVSRESQSSATDNVGHGKASASGSTHPSSNDKARATISPSARNTPASQRGAARQPSQAARTAPASQNSATRRNPTTGVSRTKAQAHISTQRDQAPRRNGKQTAGGASAQRGSRTPRRTGSAASFSQGRTTQRRRGPLTPLDHVKRTWQRHRALIISISCVLVVAIILLVAQPWKRGRDSDVTTPAITSGADITAGPTVVPTPEPNNDPIYPTNYRVLDGAFQTDRELGLAQGAQVDDSFFDGAIFVGDSITLKLRQFVTKQRNGNYPNLLGTAQFLTAGSFGVHSALAQVSDSSLHPTINGVKMTLEDALVTLGAKKVYIMLGMNDVSHIGIEKSVSGMGSLLKRIREKLPDADIFVQSATPRYTGEAPKTETLFNYDIQLYDQLAALKLDRIYFVDVAYVMRDENGNLPADYCSDKEDMAMHFTDKACMEWVKYLYTHTPPAEA